MPDRRFRPAPLEPVSFGPEGCSTCDGGGRVAVPDPACPPHYTAVACPTCHGTGTEAPFCSHGIPAADDCEQCRDERETADDQATDDDDCFSPYAQEIVDAYRTRFRKVL